MADRIPQKLFSKNFYDPKFELRLRNFRKVQQYKRDHQSATKKDAINDKALNLSKNTIYKYWKAENEPTPDPKRQNFFSSAKIKAAISKVSDRDKDILNIILNVYLHGKNTFDCDLTFGEGKFYSDLPYPKYSFDQYPVKSLNPGAPEVLLLDKADAIIPDNSLSSIIIDLPQEISKSGEGNIGAFKSMTDLAETYNRMLKLAEKKLRFASPGLPAGLLIIKVGDIIHKGETIWLSQIVPEIAMGEDYFTSLSEKFISKINKLNKVGFELVDKFMHHYSPEETGNYATAQRSIKAHDYYLVFRKIPNQKVKTFYNVSVDSDPKNLKGDLIAYYDYPCLAGNPDSLRHVRRKNPNSKFFEVIISDITKENSIDLSADEIPYNIHKRVNHFIEKEHKDRIEFIIPWSANIVKSFLSYMDKHISYDLIREEENREFGILDKELRKKTLSILAQAGIKYLLNPDNGQDLIILNNLNIMVSEMKEKETFFHGSPKLFETFDLSHALEGDGKVKFGYGVYVTSSYESAAHYSGAKPEWTEHYVYTVSVPRKTESNYIAFKQPVHKRIADAAAERLNVSIPSKALADGKEFRKFLAKHLLSKMEMDKDLPKSVLTLEGEKAASEFLHSIGVDLIEWPYNWKYPELGTNRAILNDKDVEIVRVDSVEIDKKKKMIPNSEKLIR